MQRVSDMLREAARKLHAPHSRDFLVARCLACRQRGFSWYSAAPSQATL